MQHGIIARSRPIIAKNETTGSLNVLKPAAALGLGRVKCKVAANGQLFPTMTATDTTELETIVLAETSLVHLRGTGFYLPKREDYPALRDDPANWPQTAATMLRPRAPSPKADRCKAVKPRPTTPALSAVALKQSNLPAPPLKTLTYAQAAARAPSHAPTLAQSLPDRAAPPKAPVARAFDVTLARGHLDALLKHCEIRKLRVHPNTHGDIATPRHPKGKRRMSVWEHSLAVALGQHGGLGLGTEMLSAKYDQVDTVKTLVLAAGLHDAGKVEKKKRAHITASVNIARSILKSGRHVSVNGQEACIIPILIRHNDIFGRYLQNKVRTLDTVKKTLTRAHEEMLQAKIAISLKNSTRLLFHLFVADATTLVALQPLATHFKIARVALAETSEPDTLQWLATLGNAEGKRPD